MKVLAVCVIAFLAFSSVQSASFHFRSGREVLIPIEEAIRADEFVAELKKEAEQLAIEEAVPVMLEEIVVPIENLRNVEPFVAVEETAAVADQELVVPVNALRDAAVEVVAVPEAGFVQETPKTVAVEEVIVAKSADDVNQIVAKKVSETVAEVAKSYEAVVPADAFLRQSAVTNDQAPTRPTLLQAAQNTINNLIANNPITNAINAIRNPSTADTPTPVIEAVQTSASATPVASAPVATETDAAAPVTAERPTFVQQVQNGVTNFQHQIQSALNNVQTSAAAVVNGNRPNIIQTIQTALNRPIQAIFRPSSAATTSGDDHDAVAVDDSTVATQSPAVSADASAVNVAHEVPEPAVTIVKQGIELVSDKVDA